MKAEAARRGDTQVDPTSDRRSWGILGRRRSAEEPVDRARAVENAHTAFPTSSLDGAQNAPPTTVHKADRFHERRPKTYDDASPFDAWRLTRLAMVHPSLRSDE